MPAQILHQIYDNTVRHVLPRKLGVEHGVARYNCRLFDRTRISESAEEALLEGLSRHVRLGDSVVIVGGGRGVSTVVAARRADRVRVYEPVSERVDRVEETASLNFVSDTVEIHHARVGEIRDTMDGDPSGAGVVSPTELPECDVLELDCEGAELEILENIRIRPRAIVVECHGCFGAPEDAVRAELERLGYTIVSCEDDAPERGVYVLCGVRDHEPRS